MKLNKNIAVIGCGYWGTNIAKSLIQKKKGSITIIAPTTEKSGVSHSISFVRPSLIQKISNKSSRRST